MYISHARALVEGRPYVETGYVYNPEVRCFGTQAYPPGFSFLLVPLVASTGISIVPMLVQQALFLALLGLGFFLTLRRRVPLEIALLAALVLWTSPWILEFRTHVLSDLPFSAILLCVWALLESSSTRKWWGLFLLLPLLVLTRTVGWAVPIAMFGYAILYPVASRIRSVQMEANRLHDEGRWGWASLILWTLAGAFVVQQVLAVPKQDGYLAEMNLTDLVGIVLANLDEYLQAWMDFFPSVKALDAPGQLLASTVLVFVLLGAVSRIRRFAWWDLMVTVYVLLLLVWPCFQGFRFLLPLLAFFIMYALEGSRLLPWGWWPARLLLLAWVGINLASLVFDERPDTVRGPYHPDAVELFDAVRVHTEPSARVDFFKPRVMALYGERRSGYPVEAFDPLFDSHYCVTLSGVELTHDETRIWQGRRFALWQLPESQRSP